MKHLHSQIIYIVVFLSCLFRCGECAHDGDVDMEDKPIHHNHRVLRVRRFYGMDNPRSFNSKLYEAKNADTTIEIIDDAHIRRPKVLTNEEAHMYAKKKADVRMRSYGINPLHDTHAIDIRRAKKSQVAMGYHQRHPESAIQAKAGKKPIPEHSKFRHPARHHHGDHSNQNHMDFNHANQQYYYEPNAQPNEGSNRFELRHKRRKLLRGAERISNRNLVDTIDKVTVPRGYAEGYGGGMFGEESVETQNMSNKRARYHMSNKVFVPDGPGGGVGGGGPDGAEGGRLDGGKEGRRVVGGAAGPMGDVKQVLRQQAPFRKRENRLWHQQMIRNAPHVPV